MEYSYKFRLYPKKEQENLIRRTFGCTRFVYNYYLAKRKKVHETEGRTMNFYECSKDMTALKQELLWLKEVDSKALQSALNDLDAAYKNFFRSVKSGGKTGFPRYRSKRDRHKSYKTNSNIAVINNHVRLPKLGLVKCRVSRAVKGRILSATVSQEPSGKFFVALCCTDVEIEPLPLTGANVGIDVGLRSIVTTSDGVKYENHHYFRKSQKKLARLQRQLSRKSKGSNRREKARVKVACLHEKIANQRNDALHKLSISLVRNYDLLAVEDLEVKTEKHYRNLARAISDTALGEFLRQLKYKAAWYGKRVVVVDRFFPSSQICSVCGYSNAELKKLSVRKWICPQCGATHDRDINAARNILSEGLRSLA